MTLKHRRMKQSNPITEITDKYLGPFSSRDERERWESEVRQIIKDQAHLAKRGPLSLHERVRLLAEISEPGKLFARKLKTAHPGIKAMFTVRLEIDPDELAEVVDEAVNRMRGLVAFVTEELAYQPKRGRSQSWLTFLRERLVTDLQSTLARRGKPHGFTRNGKLTRFAADIWNCANGTTVGADAFYHAIDDLRKRERESKIRYTRTMNPPTSEQPMRHSAFPETSSHDSDPRTRTTKSAASLLVERLLAGQK